MSDLGLNPLHHQCKVYAQSCALSLELNCDNDISLDYSAASDRYYLMLQVAPQNSNKTYAWNELSSIILKLSHVEVLELTSVFLRIKKSLKIDKRKTSHRTFPAYKNVSVSAGSNGGLLLSVGLVPVKDTGFERIIYNLNVPQMDCVRVGLFLLGYISLKTPWVSTESIITALRLSVSKSES